MMLGGRYGERWNRLASGLFVPPLLTFAGNGYPCDCGGVICEFGGDGETSCDGNGPAGEYQVVIAGFDVFTEFNGTFILTIDGSLCWNNKYCHAKFIIIPPAPIVGKIIQIHTKKCTTNKIVVGCNVVICGPSTDCVSFGGFAVFEKDYGANKIDCLGLTAVSIPLVYLAGGESGTPTCSVTAL